MDNLALIREKIQQSIQVKQDLLADEALVSKIETCALEFVKCFKADGKVLFCGNGGSAADAQHISAELSGRFYKDRDPLFSEALHVNTSYLTAVANDYSYDEIYSRLVKAKIRKGDILVGISTSGNSANIVKAFETAKKQGGITIGMTGDTGGKMKDLSDILVNVPSSDTPRIQEVHILIGHLICELTEIHMF
ncbi:MAG: SIS domain-containing protein [Vicingaceae bacterium]|jgi:D-sedoheptulose 7-phosphate isomerase